MKESLFKFESSEQLYQMQTGQFYRLIQIRAWATNWGFMVFIAAVPLFLSMYLLSSNPRGWKT